MLADDSEQDDIKEVIKEILCAPRDNHVTQSEVVDSLWHGNNLAKMIPMTDSNMNSPFKLHELIKLALGRYVDEAVTSKKMYELRDNKLVGICLRFSPISNGILVANIFGQASTNSNLIFADHHANGRLISHPRRANEGPRIRGQG